MNKKGFTLIELLAVIVILAIIALIATPIVLNIIKDTRNSSYERSTEMYIKTVELAVARENMSEGFVPDICDILAGGNLDCYGYPLNIEMNNSKQIKAGGAVVFSNGKISEITDLNIDDMYCNYYENKIECKSENNNSDDSSEEIDYSGEIYTSDLPPSIIGSSLFEPKIWCISDGGDCFNTESECSSALSQSGNSRRKCEYLESGFSLEEIYQKNVYFKLNVENNIISSAQLCEENLNACFKGGDADAYNLITEGQEASNVETLRNLQNRFETCSFNEDDSRCIKGIGNNISEIYLSSDGYVYIRDKDKISYFIRPNGTAMSYMSVE